MATETRYAASISSGTVSTPANAYGAADGSYTTDADNTSWTCRFNMDALSVGVLTTGTDGQSVTVRTRKETGTGTPSYVLTVYEGGSLVYFGGTTNVTSTTSQDDVFTWTSTGTDGSDIDIQLAVTAAGGSPSARSTVQLDSIAWTADYTTLIEYSGGASPTTLSVSTSSGGVVGKFGEATRSVTFAVDADGVENHPEDKDITKRTVFRLGIDASVTEYTGGASARTVTVTTSASGAVAKIGSASARTETVTTTATGLVGKIGSANATGLTVTTSAAGAVAVVGSATAVAETVSLSSTGVVGKVASATTVTETVSLTATGSVAVFGGSTLSESVTLTSSGVVGVASGASLPVTVSLSAAGAVAVFGGASLTETVTITASGVASGTNNASLTETVTVTASGTMAYQQGASRTVTASVTAGGVVATSSGASRAVTVTTSAAGNAAVTSGGTRTVSVTTEAGGVIAAAQGATTTAVTVGVTAGGLATADILATRTITVGLTATGQVDAPGSAVRALTVTTSSSGTALAQSGGSATAVVQISAMGVVTILRVYFDPPTRDVAYGRRLAPKAWWVKKEEGITLIKRGSEWSQTLIASDDELRTADRYYLGGRRYVIDETQRSELIAAGYGDLITEEYVNV